MENNIELEKKADEVIDLLEGAQEEDGYLNTYFQLVEPEKKWSNILGCHELYCAGHLIEAAIAYYKGTGKDKILKNLPASLQIVLMRNLDRKSGRCMDIQGIRS